MTSTSSLTTAAKRSVEARPRLGFAGIGWIGRNRMEAVVAADVADVAAVADAAPQALEGVRELVPRAEVFATFDELLESDLDGVVIATPSALHAEQCVAALSKGIAVFCQKPLARSAAETKQVLQAARDNDRLLSVDLSYRWTRALREMRAIVASGRIGNVFSADLVFHNAYGPDKPWFLDAALSGGGCAIDLGTHLVDAALWMLNRPAVEGVDAVLFKDGRRVSGHEVEDHALVSLDLAGGARARIACSWFLDAGRDAQIELTFYGDDGAVSMRNVDGSFYDFTAELWEGTRSTVLVEPPDAWGGRAILEWTQRLARDPSFDADAEHLVDTARVLDLVYGRGS